MIWIGAGVAIALAFGGVVAALLKRPRRDLGSVSDAWIAQHRADTPHH